jgi:hypothetical protein
MDAAKQAELEEQRINKWKHDKEQQAKAASRS